MKTYKFLIGYHIKTARSFNLLATILTNVWHNKAILKILFVCCNATDKKKTIPATQKKLMPFLKRIFYIQLLMQRFTGLPSKIYCLHLS